MKKLIAFILALAATAALVACDGDDESEKTIGGSDMAGVEEPAATTSLTGSTSSTAPTVPTAPSIYAQQGKCRNHAAFSTLKTIKQPL